jgi:hypothetical protein
MEYPMKKHLLIVAALAALHSSVDAAWQQWAPYWIQDAVSLYQSTDFSAAGKAAGSKIVSSVTENPKLSASLGLGAAAFGLGLWYYKNTQIKRAIERGDTGALTSLLAPLIEDFNQSGNELSIDMAKAEKLTATFKDALATLHNALTSWYYTTYPQTISFIYLQLINAAKEIVPRSIQEAILQLIYADMRTMLNNETITDGARRLITQIPENVTI